MVVNIQINLASNGPKQPSPIIRAVMADTEDEAIEQGFRIGRRACRYVSVPVRVVSVSLAE